MNIIYFNGQNENELLCKTEKHNSSIKISKRFNKKCINKLTKEDAYNARCKWCSIHFTVKYDGERTLKNHHATKVYHEPRILSNQSLTNFIPITSNLIRNLKIIAIELLLIYHELNHHSYLSTKCEVYLNNDLYKELSYSQIHCGRIKIKCIAENVGLFLKSVEMVLQEMQNLLFSISTDASTKKNKFFSIVIHYLQKNASYNIKL